MSSLLMLWGEDSSDWRCVGILGFWLTLVVSAGLHCSLWVEPALNPAVVVFLYFDKFAHHCVSALSNDLPCLVFSSAD